MALQAAEAVQPTGRVNLLRRIGRLTRKTGHHDDPIAVNSGHFSTTTFSTTTACGIKELFRKIQLFPG